MYIYTYMYTWRENSDDEPGKPEDHIIGRGGRGEWWGKGCPRWVHSFTYDWLLMIAFIKQTVEKLVFKKNNFNNLDNFKPNYKLKF